MKPSNKNFRRGKMDFWEKVKRDIQRGMREGIGVFKGGVTVVKEKAEELTEEGKKRLKVFELKTKVQREIAELGGKVYDLSSKVKNPMLDSKVKAVISRVKKLETQIAKLEGKVKGTTRKVAKKRTVKSNK
jgi:peptidoglycan hydrolase CwlO-like protein